MFTTTAVGVRVLLVMKLKLWFVLCWSRFKLRSCARARKFSISCVDRKSIVRSRVVRNDTTKTRNFALAYTVVMFESDQHVSDQHNTKVSARNPELCRVPAANRRRNECSADFPAAKLFLNRRHSVRTLKRLTTRSFCMLLIPAIVAHSFQRCVRI